jgi:hypothetical protein
VNPARTRASGKGGVFVFPMARTEHYGFVNALRGALGLGPLYGRELLDAPDRNPWWADFMGTGNAKTPRRGAP